MASPSETARAAILGIPYDPNKKPDRLMTVKAFEQMDAKVIGVSAGAIIRDTKANLDAVANPPANQMAWVLGDSAPANNGIYQNIGSPSAPVWARRGDLPFSIIPMINVGAGTASVIVATSSLPAPSAPGAALFSINIVADNTGPVTINGKPWLTNVGNEFVAGGIKAGGIYLFLDNGDHYRALTDQDVSALVAAAEGYANAALSAVPNAFPINRGALADLPDTITNAYLTEPGYEGQFSLVDNSGGTFDGLIAADTVGGEIKPTGDNPDLAYLRQRKFGDMIKVSEAGHDIYAALAIAAERRKLLGGDANVDVYLNAKAIPALTKGVIVPEGVSLFSDQDTLIDASQLAIPNLVDRASGQLGSGGRLIMDVRPTPGTTFASHYTEIPAEFDPVAIGDTRVKFDPDHGVGRGDVIVLHNNASGSWFNIRPEYKASYRRRVMDVVGDYAYVDRRFRDAISYDAVDCKAYIQTMRTGRFGGFTIDAGDLVDTIPSLYGLQFMGLDEGSEVADITVVGMGTAGIDFGQCLGIRPNRLSASLNLGSGDTSVYPLGITNCTGVKIQNSRGSGDWHALAFNGNGLGAVGETLNEDCWFEGCLGYNTGQTANNASAGATVHGNADQCGFRDCRIAGVNIGGRDTSYIGGSLENLSPTDAYPFLILFGEMHSGRFFVHGTTMRSIRNTGPGSPGGMISAFNRPGQVGEAFIDLKDVFIDAPNEVQPIRFGSINTGDMPVSFSFDGHVNVPSASTFVQIVNGNNAITSSYFRLDRVAGLQSGCAWAASTSGSGGHMAFNEVKYPVQQVVWTTSGVAADSELSSGNIDWPHAFPSNYTPSARAEIQSSGLGYKAHAGIAARSSSAVRPFVASGDGTNMSAFAATVIVDGW